MEEIKAAENTKILIVAEDYKSSYRKRGGIFALEEYSYYKDLGYQCFFTVLYRKTISKKSRGNSINEFKEARSHLKELKELVEKKDRHEVIDYFSFPKPFVYNESLFLFKGSAFKDMNIDIVFVHSIIHGGLHVGWLKRQFPKARIILKQHSNIALFHPIIKKIYKRIISKYDRIAFNSVKSYEDLVESGVNLEKKRVLIDYPKFKFNTCEISKTKSGRIKFCTVANLIKSKGFFESISFFDWLGENGIDWKWEIIGRGEMKEQLQSIFHEKGWTDRIVFIGELEKVALYNHLLESDIYLQLSYRETFGIAPIEAYSFYNKLVISTEITSVNELINDIDNVFKIDMGVVFSNYCNNKLLDFIQQDANLESFKRNIKALEKKLNSTVITKVLV